MECGIKDCDKPEYQGHGMCVKHWRRLQRNGNPLVARPPGKPAGVCSVVDCGGKHYGKGLCQRHYAQVRAGRPREDLVASWKYGSRDVSYSGAHRRARRVRGPASDHACVGEGCDKQAIDWAYNHADPDELVGPVQQAKSSGRPPIMAAYSPDPAFYVPMCRKCHRAFDRRTVTEVA